MATITETGTIDLAAQKEAHDEASQVATNYITPNGTSTAAFHPEASSTNQVKVDDTGVDIIKSGTSVANYGDIARIGKRSESRVEIDYHSLKLIDKNNNVYFHVSDLRDSTGVATVFTTIVIDDDITRTDTKTRLVLALSPDSIESVELDGNILTSDEYSLVSNSSVLEILYVLADGQEVSIEYTTSSILAKAFTFGLRNALSSLGLLSYAEGYSVASTGFTSHAEGYGTQASGNDSHAEGRETSANKMHSHAEGFQTTADGNSSHAEGSSTHANGANTHAEGLGTEANGSDSHAEGSYTRSDGANSHAEGYDTQANGLDSHAEGNGTKANGAYTHTEGYNTQADGVDSHAEGDGTTASGIDSHAEGSDTQANGDDSHTEGSLTQANGDHSHAEGSDTVAIGEASHSQNLGTIARGEAQTAIGKYNIDNTDMDLAFIVGNGTANNARSDAFTVDWDGNTNAMGLLKLRTPLINRDDTAPNSSVYDNLHCVEFTDADNENIGRVRMHQASNGYVGITMQCRNEKTDGTEVINEISVSVGRDGTRVYGIADPAAFRSAIAAFSTSGGIITGPVYVKNTVIDRKVNPSSAQYTTDVGGNSAFQLCDKNGAMLGYLRASKQTDGRTGLDLRVWNSDTDGNNVVNGAFQIFIDRSGTVSYSIANQTGFRNAIGASSGIFPRSVGGTGMSARTTGTVTRSGLGTDGTINVYSNGVTCTLAASNVKLKAALATSSSVQLATLPAGYRPPMNVFTNISSPSQTYNGGAWVRVDNSGIVTLGNYSGSQFTTSTQLYFTITWAL